MIRTITQAEVLHYATVSKDQAAIHMDPKSAKRAGFERPIVHGMYLMGLAQSIYIKEHPTHWIVNYYMKFRQSVLVDEEVSFQFEQQQSSVEVSIMTKENRSIAIGNFEIKECLA